MAEIAVPVKFAKVESGWLKFIRDFARTQPLGVVSFFLLAIMLVMAIGAPWIAPFDPTLQTRADLLKPPGNPYWFGTDNLGRDILSRVIWGAQTSLRVGVIAVIFGTLIGSAIGVSSGYFGSGFDLIVQRIMDSMMSVPTIILAMVVIAVLGPGIEKVILAVAIVQIPRVCRVVRGNVLSVREQVYIEAARTIGSTHTRIMTQHILPNVFASIMVMATITLGQAILIEASLSFLGLGTPPPAPSWGGMLSDAGRTFMLRAPWIALFPGLAITLAVLSFNLLGDSLRDMLDPHLRSSH